MIASPVSTSPPTIDPELPEAAVDDLPADGRNRFAEGFVVASLVFCVGPLTVLGSINDGLGDPELLYIKAGLDGFASAAFAAVYGWGVILSAITVFVVQGGDRRAVGAAGRLPIGYLARCAGFGGRHLAAGSVPPTPRPEADPGREPVAGAHPGAVVHRPLTTLSSERMMAAEAPHSTSPSTSMNHNSWPDQFSVRHRSSFRKW